MKTTKPKVKQAESNSQRPLDGFKVLEWTDFVAGPFCAKLLASLGAEVIKIEEPATGDIARRRGPFLRDIPHPERSALFLFLNTDKKGITLNLKAAAGRELFKKLVKEADVLVAEQPPALVEEWGLGYQSLSEINPQLIMASITPFGQTGPYRDYKSYYLNNFHAGGSGYVNPFDPQDPHLDREPLIMGGFFGEYHGGLNAALAITAALYTRMMMGVGQHIDISKQETLLNAQRPDMARYLHEGRPINRAGANIPGGLRRSSGIMRCKDGYLNMHINENQVAVVFEMMGKPELAKDGRFTPENLPTHREEFDAYVQEWVKDHNREEIWHGAQQRGIPVAAIYSVAEAARSEHLQARGFFAELDHPEAGKLRYPAVPFKLSKTPLKFQRAAPLLGEHNEEIYCRWLGYSREDLAQMRRTGVI